MCVQACVSLLCVCMSVCECVQIWVSVHECVGVSTE